MFLTRVFLDPKSAAVRADLRAPESLHKTVMRAFPNDDGPTARAIHGVLHRLDHDEDDRIVLLVQSATKPDTSRWPTDYALSPGRMSDDDSVLIVRENPATRSVAHDRDAIVEGARLAFRLRANTTRKIDTKSGPDGKRRNGRRVPLRGDADREAWLRRHAEAGGFAVDEGSLRITEMAANGGVGSKSVTLAGAMFEGTLVVRDPSRFRESLAHGIGPGKAYGFGLLSVKPVR